MESFKMQLLEVVAGPAVLGPLASAQVYLVVVAAVVVVVVAVVVVAAAAAAAVVVVVVSILLSIILSILLVLKFICIGSVDEDPINNKP